MAWSNFFNNGVFIRLLTNQFPCASLALAWPHAMSRKGMELEEDQRKTRKAGNKQVRRATAPLCLVKPQSFRAGELVEQLGDWHRASEQTIDGNRLTGHLDVGVAVSVGQGSGMQRGAAASVRKQRLQLRG